MIGRRPARHVETGGAPHRVGVVLVLHTQPRAQRGIREVRDVARGIDVDLAGTAGLIHHDPAVHAPARPLPGPPPPPHTEPRDPHPRHAPPPPRGAPPPRTRPPVE